MTAASRSLVVVSLVVIAGCKDKNSNATAVGTAIIEWDHTSSDRASIKTAKIGARKSQNIAHRAHMVDGSVVELGIALVTAPVTLEEDGMQKEYLAPVLIVAKLDKNADFTFADAKCVGPNYQMARPTPREMILECRARARKPSADIVLAFDVYGDGRVVEANPAPPAKPAK